MPGKIYRYTLAPIGVHSLSEGMAMDRKRPWLALGVVFGVNVLIILLFQSFG